MTWLNSLFLWFYCLPIANAALLILAATLLFLLLDLRFCTRRVWKTGMICLLLLWLIAVIWTTVLGRTAVSDAHDTILIPFYSYYTVLTGGNPELLRSNFMNVLLFYPAGLLITSLLSGKFSLTGKLLCVLILFGALSTGIELLQHTLQIGRSEIDDVLHNTLGALLGGWALSAKPCIANAKNKLFSRGGG